MSVITDPIADFITRLRNAGEAGREIVVVPHSKLRMAVAELLKKEGYVRDVEKRGRKTKKHIAVTVRYEDEKTPYIRGVKKVSKSSRRVYVSSADIRPVRQGHGTLVVSTPEGVMTGDDAKKKGIGGEILFEIW